MKTLLNSLLAAVLSLSLLTGCSSKKTLVGKWKGQGGEIEFTKDKKVLMTTGGITVNATYSIVDDSHFNMTVDTGAAGKTSQVVTYSTDGKTLTMDTGVGKQELKRVD